MSLLKISLLVLFGSLLLITAGCTISQSNQEVELRNQFNQKDAERTAFYDNLWKTVAQKSEVAVKNDSSFRQNVNIIMAGRKDAPNVFMKWITETNPNANFEQVSILYHDLSRTIEAKRDQFFQQEKVLQDIKLQHDNILSKFPSTIVMGILGRQHLKYKPITSDRMDHVIETGKDNDTKVFGSIPRLNRSWEYGPLTYTNA